MFSDGLKINVNRSNADEALLVLLQIDHPFLSAPIRLVNDNKDFVLMGENFLAMPFKIQRQSDIQGELPKITLTISNVGRSLIRWIDSSGGAKDSTLNVMLSRRSTPGIVEESLTLGIESINISTENVVFNLVVQNNLVKRSMRYIYDQRRAQGLF